MWTALIEKRDVLAKDTPKLVLAEQRNVVEVAACGPDHLLARGVHLGVKAAKDLDICAFGHVVKCSALGAELAIAIANEESR